MRRLDFVNPAYKGALRSDHNTPRLQVWPMASFVGNPRFRGKGTENGKSTFEPN